jgi:hypothetical protein
LIEGSDCPRQYIISRRGSIWSRRKVLRRGAALWLEFIFPACEPFAQRSPSPTGKSAALL